MVEPVAKGIKYFSEDGDAWISWRFFGNVSIEDLEDFIEKRDLFAYYPGVGRPFAGVPLIEMGRHHALITRRGGWDV